MFQGYSRYDHFQMSLNLSKTSWVVLRSSFDSLFSVTISRIAWASRLTVINIGAAGFKSNLEG